MFEDVGKTGKRQWQCFVCGRNHDNYESYREHIVGEHDQGREFLLCPDCQAPVRDMKMHYKAKHPQRIMPKGLQQRVVVWKDYKSAKKKKDGSAVTRVQARKGTYISKKSGWEFQYRSGMEEEFFTLLDEDTDVESFFGEPFKVPYFWKGEWHNYIPDIRINYADGSTEIWEVKPASQTGPEYEQNQAKWAAMHNYAENLGWTFVVQTEVGLGKLKKKIERQRPLND